jgi:tRNA-(ms[2]io[6]A)-hydroxylase
MKLKCPTAPEWVVAVLDDFNAFLLDHAANERKASASALTLLLRYPDKTEIIEPLIALAQEELAHFHEVYRLMAKRSLRFERDTKDPYLAGLKKAVGRSEDHELLDRLLLAGIVEARGCERFGLLAEALVDVQLKRFYDELAQSEARHADLFVALASHYYEPDQISLRLERLLTLEAEVVSALPHRAALH